MSLLSVAELCPANEPVLNTYSHCCDYGFTNRGGSLGYANPSRLHRPDLFRRGSLPARDDRARVAHPSSRRRGLAGDESHHRLFHVRLDELRRSLFRVASNLSDHHHDLGLRIAVEQFERIHEIRSDDRIATDADRRGLPDVPRCQLVDRFVGQRPRPRDDSDRAFAVMMPGQFGPISRERRSCRKSHARTMSRVGMPSVMQTINSTSASAASIMASAANGGGTKMTDAFAPVFSTASCTVLKIGQPSCVVPPFPGVAPATTFVPYSAQALA